MNEATFKVEPKLEVDPIHNLTDGMRIVDHDQRVVLVGQAHHGQGAVAQPPVLAIQAQQQHRHEPDRDDRQQGYGNHRRLPQIVVPFEGPALR